mgnify:CR=1 FL=1
MNVHESQAKGILESHGVNVPRGGVAETPEEAELIAQELGSDLFVIKAPRPPFVWATQYIKAPSSFIPRLKSQDRCLTQKSTAGSKGRRCADF